MSYSQDVEPELRQAVQTTAPRHRLHEGPKLVTSASSCLLSLQTVTRPDGRYARHALVAIISVIVSTSSFGGGASWAQPVPDALSESIVRLCERYADATVDDVALRESIAAVANAWSHAQLAEHAAALPVVLDLCEQRLDHFTAFELLSAVLEKEPPNKRILAAAAKARVLATVWKTCEQAYAQTLTSDEAARLLLMPKGQSVDTVDSLADLPGFSGETVNHRMTESRTVIFQKALIVSAPTPILRYAEYKFALSMAALLPQKTQLSVAYIAESDGGCLISETELPPIVNLEGRPVDVDAERRGIAADVESKWRDWVMAGDIRETKERLSKVEQEVRSLKERLQMVEGAHEALRNEFERFQAEIRPKLDAITAATNYLLRTTAPECVILERVEDSQADSDADGIDDGYEQQLLATFAPVFRVHDRTLMGPMPFVGVPMDASTFIGKVKDETTPQKGHGDQPHLLLEVQSASWRWGEGWIGVMQSDQSLGFYGRVWRPEFTGAAWRDSGRTIYSVQYYLFLSFSGRGANNHVEKGLGLVSWDIYPFAGTHDGDWVCIDLGVDVTEKRVPFIDHAVCHNHGRQLFLYPRALSIRVEGKRRQPLVYLEDRSNEPWPNAGSRDEDWPTTGGFATNCRFIEHVKDMKVMDENEVCGEHWGLGAEYNPSKLDGRVRNLGEIGIDGRALPADTGDADALAVLRQTEPYGWFAAAGVAEVFFASFGVLSLNLQDRIPTGAPLGPPFQENDLGNGTSQPGKMWYRRYNKLDQKCPFSEGTDPLNPPLGHIVTRTTEGGAVFVRGEFDR